MSKLIFDMQSGIAGDMTVAAAFDLGLEATTFIKELKTLPLEFDATFTEVKRSGIRAKTFAVQFPHQHSHRHLTHILDLIGKSSLDGEVKRKASAIFMRLGEAEAKVHGVSVDEVHFHEVGAVDAIVDITGASLAFSILGISDFYVTPFTFGTGTIKCDHGTFSIPAPATAELTLGFQSRRVLIESELTTPTGAAIATAFSRPISELGDYVAVKTGYGAGTKELEGLPNVLRLTLCEKAASTSEKVVEIETNVDDATGEIIGRTIDRLMANSALDAFTIPIGMKKGRPGVLVCVLCAPGDKDKLSRILLKETGSIGLRYTEKNRVCLPRKAGSISTRYGEITTKVIDLFGEIRITPEYESCKAAADKHNVPLRLIYEEVAKKTGV